MQVACEISQECSELPFDQGKSVPPRQLTQLARVMDWLDSVEAVARMRGNRAAVLRTKRDRAFVLLGFWCGLRCQELIRLRIEHIDIMPRRSVRCFLPVAEGSQAKGIAYWLPSLSILCPVAATLAWKNEVGSMQGPLFRAINHRSVIAGAMLRQSNAIRLLRHIFTHAGLRSSTDYIGHPLRRGFAGWADDGGWDARTLMEYVGLKDGYPAERRIDGRPCDLRSRSEGHPSAVAPAPPVWPAPGQARYASGSYFA